MPYSSLLAWSQAAGNVHYTSLIGFFHSSWEAQTLVAYAWQRIHPLTGGWLILDEIVLEKTIVGRCLLVKNRWKTTKGHVTPAVAIVMLLWTNGIWRIPLRFKLWKPMCVVFDAGFAAAALLCRINDYGWAFVCRAPCSRRFEGVQLKKYSCQLSDDAAYERYPAMSVVTFIALEAVRIHHPSPVTIYQLRRKATLGQRIPIPQRLHSLKHVA
jgi:hypothetical protein